MKYCYQELTFDPVLLYSEKLRAPYVMEKIDAGMSAIVYHLKFEEREYALKVKRDISLVKSEEGEKAFQNEILVRKKIEELRSSDMKLSHLSRTSLLDEEKGIILSEWIRGTKPYYYNQKRIRSLFHALWELEMTGFFELDLCQGNLMFDENDEVFLYDFGYTYPINILTQYNFESEKNRVFHMVERFETRAFFQHLLDMEEERGKEFALFLYGMEKEEALAIYKEKYEYLKGHFGQESVLDFLEIKIREFENVLNSEEELNRLYRIELFRSCLLDVEDDLSAPYSSPDTLKKIRTCRESFDKYSISIRENDGLFFGDELKSDTELKKRFEELEMRVLSLCPQDTESFDQWKKETKELALVYYDREK